MGRRNSPFYCTGIIEQTAEGEEHKYSIDEVYELYFAQWANDSDEWPDCITVKSKDEPSCIPGKSLIHVTLYYGKEEDE